MTRMLASSLAGKKVVSSEGDELGDFKDIITDVDSGELEELVVDPEMGIENAGYRHEDGLIYLPFDSVKAIKEYIVVSNEKAKAR